MCLNADRVIVLDLDDTIGKQPSFKEKNGLRAIDQLAFDQLRIRRFADRCHHAGPLATSTEFFARVLSEVVPPVSTHQVQEFMSCFQSHQPPAQPIPETIQLLTELSRFCLLVILADGPFMEQKAKCVSCGLERHVDRIVYPDYWGRGFWMPHPRALMSIQNCSGLESTQCTLVASGHHKGLAAARGLGWQTMRIGTSARSALHASVAGNVAALRALCQTLAGSAKAA